MANDLAGWTDVINEIADKNRQERKVACTIFNRGLENHTISYTVGRMIELVEKRQHFLRTCGTGGCNRDAKYAALAAKAVLHIDAQLEALVSRD